MRSPPYVLLLTLSVTTPPLPSGRESPPTPPPSTASLLAGFADVRPVHSLVLLVNATDRNPILLNLLTRSSGFKWYAAANMLLENRAPALAAHLLDTLRLRLTITVTDSDESVGVGDA